MKPLFTMPDNTYVAGTTNDNTRFTVYIGYRNPEPYHPNQRLEAARREIKEKQQFEIKGVLLKCKYCGEVVPIFGMDYHSWVCAYNPTNILPSQKDSVI